MEAEIESGFLGRILYGVTAPFYLAKLFQPYFSERAAIVNISSSRDRMSQPQTESYTAAKGEISVLTHALAVSLAGRVRVNSISPGWIDTDFTEYTGADAVQQPVHRVGNPMDIANKMPILYSFYNEGDVRLAVTDDEVVESWKKFFDRGTNWKDFPKVTSYEEYRKITDKQHLSKAKSMPIKFLKASGKGFFIDKDGYALGIRDELADVIKVDAFKKQMKDIIEYRTMEYYRRRYVEN